MMFRSDPSEFILIIHQNCSDDFLSDDYLAFHWKIVEACLSLYFWYSDSASVSPFQNDQAIKMHFTEQSVILQHEENVKNLFI